MKKCKCGVEIPAARLAALPSTKVCVSCSTEQPVQGVMLWDHKTAPYIHIGTPKDLAEIRRHSRRGVTAQLPLGNKRSVGDFRGTEPKFSAAGRSSNILNAKCHPDRPRVTPDGKCVECALLWYERRRK